MFPNSQLGNGPLNIEKVLVLMGGLSAERDVSLVSGNACAEALRRCGYSVECFDTAQGLPALIQVLGAGPDVVFNALHGPWGEDGRIQGVLDLMGIPYTHSGMLASAMAMDKTVTRNILSSAGIRFAPGGVYSRSDFERGEPMSRPYVIKPLAEGSSKGVKIVHAGDASISAVDWAFGDTVLVEKFIPGRELTVAVMGGRALAVTELRPHKGFYDYAAKYEPGRTQHLLPAPIPPEVRDQALREALAAHELMGCRGMTRTDFRYNDRPETEVGAGLYMLEINTQPGMTPSASRPSRRPTSGSILRSWYGGWSRTHCTGAGVL